jgi:cell division protein FtsI (penicillin-binding protein 3)
VLAFYNAVANDGKMVSPYLVERISSYGRTRDEFHPQVLAEGISSRGTIDKAKKLLEGVVERGTAQRVKTEYFKIAGKTGTAQLAQGSAGYSKVYQSSFVGYFPAENPKYSCIVVVNAPSKGVYYGGSVAGPVFKEVAEKVYALSLEKQENLSAGKAENWLDAPTYSPKGFQQDFKSVYETIAIPYQEVKDEVWVDATVEADTVKFQTEPVQQQIVPDVRGMGLRDALYLLENRQLEVQFEGSGKVVWQSVRAGTSIVEGGHSSIQLKLN